MTLMVTTCTRKTSEAQEDAPRPTEKAALSKAYKKYIIS